MKCNRKTKNYISFNILNLKKTLETRLTQLIHRNRTQKFQDVIAKGYDNNLFFSNRYLQLYKIKLWNRFPTEIHSFENFKFILSLSALTLSFLRIIEHFVQTTREYYEYNNIINTTNKPNNVQCGRILPNIPTTPHTMYMIFLVFSRNNFINSNGFHDVSHV